MAYHRAMHRSLRPRLYASLAAFAMLSLACLPTAGRLFRAMAPTNDSGALSATGPESGFGAICSARGLAFDAALAVREAQAFGLARNDTNPARPDDTQNVGGRRDDGAPAPHADEDCDYCSLAASAAPPGIAPLAAHPPPAGDRIVGRSFAAISRRHPNGLGSRGPPA